MNQIQSPAGLRDFMPGEVRKKRSLQKKIETIFKNSGCEEISTPAMEYEATYKAAFSDHAQSEMFTFAGQQGNLALRLDMTVPIARTASTKLKDERPLRLFYTEDVFKVRKLFQGQRSQVTDCGVEMFGIPETADLEILALACKVLDEICEEWVLEIGDVRYFALACQNLGIKKEQIGELADLIHRKSMVDLKQWLEDNEVPRADFFQALPLLVGKEDALEKAMELAVTDEQRQLVAQLDHLCSQLETLGYGDRIQIDLGKVPHLDYYTGRIFEGFCPGVGFAVLSGGRYDELLSVFGDPSPAAGFSVKLDYLTDLEPEIKEPEPVIIRIGTERICEGLKLAEKVRASRPAIIEYVEEDIVEVVE